MSKRNKNPIVELKEMNGKECIYFTFKGIFTSDDAENAIKDWKTLIGSKKTKQVTLIWECLEMKNYEIGARTAWQKAIKDLKNEIDMIWLITDSIVIQAGAEIISFFTSYDIRIVGSKEELIEQMTLKV